MNGKYWTKLYNEVLLPGKGHTMDKEVIALCEAMNKLEGIHTTESCSGHDERSFKVWFFTDRLEALPPLLYWLDA